MIFKVPHIFIKGNVPSSKNSKRVVKTKNGRRMVINSALVMKYKKDTEILWKTYEKTFKRMIENESPPYKIGCYFIRDSKRRWDYINIKQILFDLMQDHTWLEEDDSSIIASIPAGFHVDPKNAGVHLFIIKDADYKELLNKYIDGTK